MHLPFLFRQTIYTYTPNFIYVQVEIFMKHLHYKLEMAGNLPPCHIIVLYFLDNNAIVSQFAVHGNWSTATARST